MFRFLSFLRFVEFDENIALLYQLKGQWAQRTNQRPDDSDEPEPSSCWNADDIPSLSKRNERKIWLRIKSMAEEFVARYPTTLAEDMEILENDTPEYS